MQLQGSRADPAQLERLQAMLVEKNGEIQNLMSKLQRLEKVEVSSYCNDGCYDHSVLFSVLSVFFQFSLNN